MRSFFDTNILVYLFDAGSPEKQGAAREILEREVLEGRAVLSTQVLQELYVAVTRKLAAPLPPADAERAVRDLATLPTVQIDKDLILRGIRRSRASVLSFWDALILEAALEANATTLFTEDLQHGQVIGGLRIANPFVPPAPPPPSGKERSR
ncbi:MAG: PIN domain-containing protein [Deferrisomatales bacterium]